MTVIKESLAVTLADTYTLYLKTQNYHWHVRGSHFSSLHALFEMQYKALAEAVDAIAERMLMLGFKAPATFRDFDRLKRLKDGDSSLSANEMLRELAADNERMVKNLNDTLALAQESSDEGSVNLITDRIAAHEKAHWMLRASAE